MSAQFGARFAAGSARERHFMFNFALRGIAIATTILVAGCTPATTPLAAADPANPSAGAAGVGYRSTVAPYTSLRPQAPAPWRERNDGVIPPAGTERRSP